MENFKRRTALHLAAPWLISRGSPAHGRPWLAQKTVGSGRAQLADAEECLIKLLRTKEILPRDRKVTN